MIMRFISGLFVNTVLGSLFMNMTLAQNLPENATFFTGHPPSLTSVRTPNNTVNWPYAHYYFTISIPIDCPQSVGMVTIYPQPNISPVTFDIENTQVFEGGDYHHKNNKISASVTKDKNGLISVTFSPPVSPGKIFTIGLEAEQNPFIAGIYQYTVKVFPSGINPIGLGLGVGRISIYSFSR